MDESNQPEEQAQEGALQIQCIDCPNTFEFTKGEQEFYSKNNYVNPKRCPSCRVAKKRRMAQKGEVRGFRQNDHRPRIQDEQPY